MEFGEYQKQARKTALYPNQGNNILYPALGLCGESGEVAEQIKKSIRDDHGTLTEERKGRLVKELGDVLWYCAMLAFELDVSLDEVAEKNLSKLADRHQRGVIRGEGSER